MKKLKNEIVKYVNLTTGSKRDLHTSQAIRKIQKRINELEIEVENAEIDEVVYILRNEICNLRELKLFLES